MNRIEDSQSTLYLARAFDKSNKQEILDDQEIPKSTNVALLVFNRSSSPLNARVCLANIGQVKRIEPQQKKKFSLVASQNCTLRDLQLKVESDAGEKQNENTVLEPKEEKTASEEIIVRLKLCRMREFSKSLA